MTTLMFTLKTQEGFPLVLKLWESDTYLAPDVYISIFVQQSSHYLHMTSSYSSDQHRLSTLEEFRLKCKELCHFVFLLLRLRITTFCALPCLEY